MKKIIQLLQAHGIEVFHAQDTDVIHGDQNQEASPFEYLLAQVPPCVNLSPSP